MGTNTWKTAWMSSFFLSFFLSKKTMAPPIGAHLWKPIGRKKILQGKAIKQPNRAAAKSTPVADVRTNLEGFRDKRH
jgi:hypothetical protein